jgi:beta-galactosidase
MTKMTKTMTALALLVAMLWGAEAQAQRTVDLLNFGWRFHAGDVANAAQKDLDDSSWRVVNLPHDFQIEQPWVAPAAGEKADNNDPAANIKSRLSSRGFKEMGTG